MYIQKLITVITFRYFKNKYKVKTCTQVHCIKLFKC